MQRYSLTHLSDLPCPRRRAATSLINERGGNERRYNFEIFEGGEQRKYSCRVRQIASSGERFKDDSDLIRIFGSAHAKCSKRGHKIKGCHYQVLMKEHVRQAKVGEFESARHASSEKFAESVDGMAVASMAEIQEKLSKCWTRHVFQHELDWCRHRCSCLSDDVKVCHVNLGNYDLERWRIRRMF